MKIENDIERSKKRITLLENQNAQFKKLLNSALDITNKSLSKTDLGEVESKFWQDTIQLIEKEKLKLQEDLELLSTTEDEISVTIRKLENDNYELQKKVEVLLQQTKLQEEEMEKLRTEHTEIKFLLSHPDTNAQWFKNILQLDKGFSNSSSTILLDERHKLQKKIVNLEQKKMELLRAIEEITNPGECNKVNSDNIKSDLEKALFKAIDEVAKREFESLHLKVLELEQERSELLNALQAILDDSRRKIAEEYCKLQRKILQIEKEKIELTLSNKILLNINEEDDEKLNHVLDAFSTKNDINLNKPIRSNNFLNTAKLPVTPKASCTFL